MPNNMMSYKDAYDDIMNNQVPVDNTNQELQEFDQNSNEQLPDTFDSQAITSNQQIVLRFTQNLSQQFMQTVSYFVKICRIMSQSSGITKARYDKFQETFNKIKNLIDAAKNTRFH